MKATVYFIEITEAQRETINTEGWGCEIGERYLAAKEGCIAPATRDLFVRAAEIDQVNDPERYGSGAEAIWVSMQNGERPWTALYKPLTTFPRSMDVGDVIVWEDGRIQRVAAHGFWDVDNVSADFFSQPDPIEDAQELVADYLNKIDALLANFKDAARELDEEAHSIAVEGMVLHLRSRADDVDREGQWGTDPMGAWHGRNE